MRSITEQLSDAHKKSGLSVGELLTRTGLDIERSSLQRKLTGALRMNVDEAFAIAEALDIKLPRALFGLARSARMFGLQLVFESRRPILEPRRAA